LTTLRGPAIVLTLLAIICALLLLFILFRSNRLTLFTATILTAAWFLLTGTLALRGFFSDFAALPPHLLFALLLPAIAFAIFSFTSKSLPNTLHQNPVTWLIGFQAFRIIVELILWRGYKAGVIPIQMTFEGRNLDILIGLTAPFAAWIYQRARSATFAIVWNIAGLASVLNIAIVAILSMPTPLRHFMNDPPNTLLAQFPFIYLPAVLVPCGYIAHFLSIRQILQRRTA
jgi:hypothetical protein